jgi:hypothetical protein
MIGITFNQLQDVTASGLCPVACRCVHGYKSLGSVHIEFIDKVTLSIY